MAKQITVYTRTTCAYCPMVKEWLKTKGFTYDEVNIDEHPEQQAEMSKYTSLLTVPVVVVEDDADPSSMPKMMQGFNIGKLAEAVA